MRNDGQRQWLASVLVCVVFGCAWLSGCSREPQPPDVSSASLDPALSALIASNRRAVLKSPRSAEAWGRLGQSLQAAQFDPESVICYEHALALEPGSVRWAHLGGLQLLQLGREEGMERLAQAARLAGTQPDAPRLRYVQALVERGRFAEALTQLEPLLQQEPPHAAARLALARVRLAEGDLNAASSALEPALTNAYTARAAWVLLAQLQQRRGEDEPATQTARQAAAMPRSPDWPDPFLREVQQLRLARQHLADSINGMLANQRLGDAEAAVKQLLAVAPDDEEGLLLLGRLRLQQRRCAEAEETFRRHLTQHTNSLNGLVQLGLAQLCQQRWDEAAGTLRQALALKPDFTQAHFNLGYALSRSGDSAGAIRSYREALRCSPGEANIHVALAEALLRDGQVAQARDHATRALAIRPGDPKARQLLKASEQ